MVEVGDRHGRLVVTEFLGSHNGRRLWSCRCDCGKTVEVSTGALNFGKRKSCGCARRENFTNKTHGLANSPEYKIWCAMKRRCHSPKDPAFANYGGRGIVMCYRWRYSFDNFIADMGPRPSKLHSIERKDNNGPYSPWNCMWGTNHQQSRNKRSNRYLTFDGRTMVMKDWADEVGIDWKTLANRLKMGWTLADALTKSGNIAQNDPRTRLNPEAAKVIRWEVAKGTSRKWLAKLHGVSYHAINDVVQGRSWA